MPKSAQKTVLNSQSRDLVIRLQEYFEREFQNGGPLLPVSQVGERVADALGIGRATVSRICKEKYGDSGMEDNKLSTPNKKRKRICPVTTVDTFDAVAIRNHVYGYYTRNELPTLKLLLRSLSEAMLFQGSVRSLAIVLKNLGFSYKKTDKRKILMERTDIAIKRFTFLQAVRKIINWDKVIFLDETWLNANHTVPKSWTDDTVQSSTKVPEGKGQRLIICHAGTAKGFVPNCLLAFKSSKTNEYHEEMNSQKFTEWFMNFLQNISEPHVILMDNAAYHSVQKDKPPGSANKKAELIEWLRSKGVEADQTMLKMQLLQLVNSHKPRSPVYVIDELAKEAGHTVIRLPPYHCQYNAIELVWAQVKGYAARHNTTPPFTAKKMLDVLKDACTNVTPNDWKNVVERTRRIINEDWERDVRFDNFLERSPLIINLQESSSESESDDDLGCTSLE